MIPVTDYINPIKITLDAIEGVTEGVNTPCLNELCTYSFWKRVEVFRCVYVAKIAGDSYDCRFERANWK